MDLNITNTWFCFVNSCPSPSFLLRKYLNSRKAIVVVRILRFSYNKKRQGDQDKMA